VIVVSRKWPPNYGGLPSRNLVITDSEDPERSIEMIAQFNRPFIGRIGDKVFVIDDCESHVHAFTLRATGTKIYDIRILLQFGTLDEAAHAVFVDMFGD